jgi:cysteinyl-tRNA synthetase
MAIRLFVLQGNYRKPIDFTDDAIASAQNSWETLKGGLLFGYEHGKTLGWSDVEDESFGDAAAMRIERDSDAVQRFQAVMDSDFNTPGALAVLFELAKELRRQGNLITHQGQADRDADRLRQQWQTLVCLAQVLGLEANPADLAAPAASGLSDDEINAMIQQRTEARQAKDFATSDRIRDELQDQGITLIDKPGGVTEWHR